MKCTPLDPPRVFAVGAGSQIKLRDCGRLALEVDEQITLTTPAGAEYDLTRKAWGFYATPSLNGRLRQFGLRAVLVRNPAGRYYVLLVEQGCEEEFFRYLQGEQQTLVHWLDSDEALAALHRKLEDGQP